MPTRALGSPSTAHFRRTPRLHPLLARMRGLSPFVARLRELVPLTTRGLFVAGLSALALRYYGFEALDAVWYVMGLGLLALSAVTLIAVLVATVRLKVWLVRHDREPPEKIGSETGRLLHTGFSSPRLRFWPLIEVRSEIRTPREVAIDPRADGPWLVERVAFSDHGEVRRLARTLWVRDVFGLASLGLRHDSELEIDVLPHVGALRSLPLLRSLSGGDDIPHPMGIEQGDRLELRRYAPGDPARFIHWKVFARTQKLVVRMPERALSRAQRVAAYLVAGPSDGASAAAARVALEEGALGGDFRFGADGSPLPTRDTHAALVALRRSSVAREHGAEQLEAFVHELDREGPSSLVLFVPPVEGPWVDRIGTLLAKRARAARVVIGVDGITQRAGASWLERVALAPSHSARVPLAPLRDLIARYRRQGCEVVVLDRESGRLLGDAHLRPAPREAPRREAAA